MLPAAPCLPRRSAPFHQPYLLKAHLFLLLSAILLIVAGHADAVPYDPAPKIIFSQEVLGYDHSGAPLPAPEISPSRIEGVKRLQFTLGEKNLLAIETNVPDPENRGLGAMVETINRCYRFIELHSGRSLETNILLYVIELDFVPSYFKFRAEYAENTMGWGEVRLVLIPKGAPLAGPDAPADLQELIYDTLPHELGHDMLAQITNLLHDRDGEPSNHTRWFIEGVCEVLAKSFSRSESPTLWRRFIDQRKISSVMHDESITSAIFSWSQENGLSLDLESDLYGASMLILLGWTESQSLDQILAAVTSQDSPLNGEKLQLMMEKSTGKNCPQMIELAHQLSVRLCNRTASYQP